jgi:hypothetical protein
MKYLRILLVLALSIALSSCDLLGGGTPQPSLASLQATAVAQAQLEVAQTAAAAQPTEAPTQQPTDVPTDTPTDIPTNTPVIPMTPIPTLATVASGSNGAAASSSAKTDYCNTTSISTMKGPHVKVLFTTQKVKGYINLYFYITETAFGCGYGNLQMNGGDSTTLSIPQGCYAFYGWISGYSDSVTHGNACFNSSDKGDHMIITPSTVYATSN